MEKPVKTRKGFLQIIMYISAGLWISCIVIFAVFLTIGTGFFKGIVDSTKFGNSDTFLIGVVGSVGVGVLTFGLMILTFIIRELIKSNTIKFNKSPIGVITFLPKIILIIGLLPLFIAYRVSGISKFIYKIKDKTYKISQFNLRDLKTVLFRVLSVAGVLAILLPVWVGGYTAVYYITREWLGYTPETTNIVGTGSMYPTWPKGTKGKDPNELSKEIISSADFLPYPNGIVIGGKRYLNHTIGRGDIVTAENDEIRKVTGSIYATSSGVIKRIVALGGDTVELRDGILYLNGQPQKEQYLAKAHSTFGEEFLRECQKYTVPNDSVFLMGDNRKGSGDSREFGPVKYSEIKLVLPFSKQIGNLDKNWHDPVNDLADVTKPTIDRNRFVELLNQKRKDNGAVPIRYEPKLEASAKARGEFMLKENTLDGDVSYDTVVNAMSKAGYWNTYVWEWRIEGYYDADELIEDFIERDSTDAKDVWFDKKFDDIGIAEVQGILNGCPTQIIVVHAAGYVPPNYKQTDIDSWQKSLDSITGVSGGWADLKYNVSFYSQHKSDIDRMNEIIGIRISRIESIVSTMRANKWLSTEQNQWIKEDQDLYNEEQSLAKKLNGE